MKRRFTLLPTRLRPMLFPLTTTPLHQHRSISIRPKQSNLKSSSQHKAKVAPATTNATPFHTFYNRVVETGGNLKLIEMLYLHDKSHKSERDSLNLTKPTQRQSILASLTKSTTTTTGPAVLRNLLDRMMPALPRDAQLQHFLMMEFITLAKLQDEDSFALIWTLLKDRIVKNDMSIVNGKDVLPRWRRGQEMVPALVELCLFFNNLILASGLIMHNKVSHSLIRHVIHSLIVKTPRYEERTIEQILKIVRRKQYIFNKFENNEILNQKFDSLSPFLQKRLLEFLIDNTKYATDKQDTHKLQNLYKLIDINFRLRNQAGCYLVWAQIQRDYPQIHTRDHDMQILSKLLYRFSNSKQYYVLADEIINGLRPFTNIAASEIILHNIISFGAKTSNLALINEVMDSMAPPFQRRTIVEILRANLQLNASHEPVKKLLEQIMEQFGALSPLENSIIIKGLLLRGKSTDALAYTDNLDVKVAKNTYLVIINHLINHSQGKFTEHQLLIINRFLSNVQNRPRDEFYDFRNDPFWSMVSSMYFKYLCMSKHNLSKAKELYINSTQPLVNKMFYLDELSQPEDRIDASQRKKLDTLMLNPFEQQQCPRFILINDESKIMILKTILDQAMKERETTTVDWCLNELNALGLSKLEVAIFVTKPYHKYVGSGSIKRSTFSGFTEYWRQLAKDVPYGYLKGIIVKYLYKK